MEYRELGSTGLKVSVIGMGCEGFSEDNYGMAKRMLDRAEELGINYFDLYASDPELRAAVGNAISGRRDKFIIQSRIGSIWKNGQYCEATAEQRDYASGLASFPRVSRVGHCMYCTHCEPCPVCLDIASVTKFMHLAEAQKTIPESTTRRCHTTPRNVSYAVRAKSAARSV